MNPKVIKAIAVTAELTGTELSEIAIRVMEQDLSVYPEAAVLRALDRCRKELKGRLTLSAVLERVEESDGRLCGDEAWAIAIGATDEADTVVWTEEIAQAFGVARPILDARDKVGARQAFLKTYERIVREAREAGVGCRWVVSIGHDADLRATALQSAVSLNRIDAGQAARYLPAPDVGPVVAALFDGKPQALLTCVDMSERDRAAARKGLDGLRRHLESLERAAAERDEKAAKEGVERASRMGDLKRAMMASVEAAKESQ